MIQSTIIETASLQRSFRKQIAVDDLTLHVMRGELFGLVGPDGAGKTTTLRLMAGLYKISAGSASILGYDLRNQSEQIKRGIGYMAQQFSLYNELSVEENLLFFADLFDVEKGQIADRMQRLLEFAGLMVFKERPAGLLSGGMQKKLALACTLIHQPEILLLDEPTTGVDPISRQEFWDILAELHLKGTTIIVSTPYMDEADRCSRVGLMYRGRMVKCAPPAEIRNGIAGELIEIYTDDYRKARHVVEILPGVLEVQTYGEALRILVDRGEFRLPQVRRALVDAGLEIRRARLAPARMEDAFISIIRQLDQ